MQHICKTFWDVKSMNIDPQNNKSDQIFSHKYLIIPHQNDPGKFPGKSGPSRSFNYLISHIIKV